MAWVATGDVGGPTALPIAIAYAGYAVAGGRLWIAGGRDENEERLTTVYSYDPMTNTWTTHEPLDYDIAPEGALAVIGDWLYMAGHSDILDEFSFLRYHMTNETTEVLNNSPSWEGIPNDIVALDGLIYAELGTVTPVVYNPSTNSWSAAPGTTPVMDILPGLRAVAVGSSILVTGGEATAGGCWWYTPGTSTWSAAPTMPNEVSSHCLVDWGGRILCLGGVDDMYTPLSQVLELVEGEWVAFDSLPGAITVGMAGAFTDRVIYVGGIVDFLPTDAGALFVGEPTGDPGLVEGEVSIGEWATSLEVFGEVDVMGGAQQLDAFGMVFVPLRPFADGVGFVDTYIDLTRAVPQLPHGSDGEGEGDE